MLYRVQKWERKNHCLRPPPKVAGKTTPDRRPNWMTRSIKEWRGGVEREGITCKNPKKIPSYLLSPSAAGKDKETRWKNVPKPSAELEKEREVEKMTRKCWKWKNTQGNQEKSNLSFGPMLHVAGKLRRRSPTTKPPIGLGFIRPEEKRKWRTRSEGFCTKSTKWVRGEIERNGEGKSVGDDQREEGLEFLIRIKGRGVFV